jgi:hypothetical protein
MEEESPRERRPMTGTLNPGEKWTEHYRGTKYHFSTEGELWWEFPATEDSLSNQHVPAQGGHKHIVEELLKLKPAGGSCRITETGEVITKLDADEQPIYVTDLGAPLTFDQIDILGTGLKPSDLWTGFYDGARYSFRGRKVWWKDPEDGSKLLVKEAIPREILKILQFHKPGGGSFRVTENGVVLTLIPPQPMPPDFQRQFDAMNVLQRNLLYVKVKGTERVPVFVGVYEDGFTVLPARKLDSPLSPKEKEELIEFLKSYGQESAVDSKPGPSETELPVNEPEDDIEEDSS